MPLPLVSPSIDAMLSATVEDYLKALYLLEQQGEGKARVKDIAAKLGVSLPSVTTMMKSMAESGHVERAAYRGVSLTESGRLAALGVIRSHRLIELFLVEVLGYTWDEVHAEAERLEHAMSDTLTDRIDAYLGFPRVDPHGDPIPDAHGRIEVTQTRSVVEFPVGTRANVERVMEQGAEVLQYLASKGIRPGVEVVVDTLEPFDGPLWLIVAGARFPLSRSLAHRIHLAVDNAAPHADDER